MVEYSSQLHAQCFPFLDQADASALLRAMEGIDVRAGTTLYTMNDSADCLYVIVSGKIAVQQQTGFGDHRQVVALLDPGAPLGESGVLDKQFRGATLTVVVDSHLLLLSRQAFTEIITNAPSLAVKVLTWLMGRLTFKIAEEF